MKTIGAIVLSLGLFAAAATAQPVIGSIQNAASNILPPLPNSSIAQGSFFAIYGTGLGPTTVAIWSPYPLPTELPTTNGSSVTVTVGSNAPVKAYIYIASAGQINAVMPSGTPTGTATVTVTYNGQTSATYSINVVGSSFGTFAFNEGGSGPGVITDASYVPITPLHTAKPGQAVILWGTGLGPVPAAEIATEATAAPCLPSGCDLRGSNLAVSVLVGNNKSASVAYAGRAPGYTALDQVVFTVPNDSTSVLGCYVQVALMTGPPSGGQVVSNFTSMAVDTNGAPCSDADGINMNDISAAVTANGKANVGVVSLLSNYVLLSLGGVTNLQFDNDSVNGEIATFSARGLDTFQGFTISPSVNNCTVQQFQGFPPPKDPGLALLTWLDAGTKATTCGGEAYPTGDTKAGSPVTDCLSVSGGQGTNPQYVARNSSGNGYGWLVGGATIANLLLGNPAPPYYLNSTFNPVASTYTVTGPGGANVGAFSGQITVPAGAASFKWTNPPTGNIPRSSPLTISWTGGDPNGFVDITAIASTLASGLEPTATTPGALIECLAPTSAGSFTIPTYILAGLPNTSNSTATVPPGELLVGPASGAVKITTPTGLDAAYLFYHFIAGANVAWQ